MTVARHTAVARRHLVLQALVVQTTIHQALELVAITTIHQVLILLVVLVTVQVVNLSRALSEGLIIKCGKLN